MSKRGRKPTEQKVDYYFDEKEEDAVVSYLESDNAEEKNMIYETSLRYPLRKMVEIIIRRYRLYIEGEDFETTVHDTTSFIISKMDKYKKDSGRAYSYLQTICKNHLIARINENHKLMVRNVSYDDFYEEINENERYSYVMEEGQTIPEQVISSAITDIDSFIVETKLNRSEQLVGNALSEALKNWHLLFPDLGSNKFNKSTVLLYLRETTNLPVNDIRSAMRKFKVLYFKNKNDYT